MNIHQRFPSKNPILHTLPHVVAWEGMVATPEWKAVKAAFRQKQLRVAAVALEVLRSHYPEKLDESESNLLSRLAQSLRGMCQK